MCKPMILSKHVERALQGQSLSMKSVFIELNKNIRHEPETVRKQPKTDTKRINYQKETKDNDKSQKTHNRFYSRQTSERQTGHTPSNQIILR